MSTPEDNTYQGDNLSRARALIVRLQHRLRTQESRVQEAECAYKRLGPNAFVSHVELARDRWDRELLTRASIEERLAKAREELEALEGRDCAPAEAAGEATQ